MIPTTALAIVAIFWIFIWMAEGIAMQSDLALIGKDIQTIKERLDKLDNNFEYIRNNMVTKSDIQQLQSDVAQSRQTFVDHLTYQHGATKP
jgi:archaellum component FlaC